MPCVPQLSAYHPIPTACDRTNMMVRRQSQSQRIAGEAMQGWYMLMATANWGLSIEEGDLKSAPRQRADQNRLINACPAADAVPKPEGRSPRPPRARGEVSEKERVGPG